MFTLPTIWNLLISTIVFFVTAWYCRRYLDEQGITKGMARGLMVFLVSSIVSWGAGEVVDWFQGPQPASQISSDPAQMLKSLTQSQP